MFLGHFALGFAAKSIDNKPSLGTTFLAAQFVDLIWPFLLLAGVEEVAIDPGNTEFTPLNFVSYPYSHSLLAVTFWGLLFGLVYYMLKRNGKTALLLGLLVISHWLLDLVVHRPDLPLTMNEETKVGLGLWNQKTVALVVELVIFSIGVFLYTHTTKAANKTGIYAFWGLVVFFLAIYFVNAFGDPPPDAKAIGYVGLAQWLFVAWGYWVDRNRVGSFTT